MRRVALCISALVLTGCSSTSKYTLPDGTVGATVFSVMPGILSPSATVAATYHCTPTCEHEETAVLGGTPLVNEGVRAAGSILTAQNLPGTSIVVSSNADARARARARGGDTEVDVETGPIDITNNVDVDAGTGPPGGPL